MCISDIQFSTVAVHFLASDEVDACPTSVEFATNCLDAQMLQDSVATAKEAILQEQHRMNMQELDYEISKVWESKLQLFKTQVLLIRIL